MTAQSHVAPQPAVTAAAMPRPAEIRGLVDGATDTRLLGWAWNAAWPEERLTVELRLGETILATAYADRHRADLARAGIGDGGHAFELPLTPVCVQRRTELSVMVRAADGTGWPLALRIRRADVDPSGSLQRVLEATAVAHRQLRADIERIARRLPEQEQAQEQEQAIRGLAAGQAALLERLDTLTLWLTRLDERLAALPAAAPAPRLRRGLDAWQRVLGGVLVLLLLGAGLGTAMLLLG